MDYAETQEVIGDEVGGYFDGRGKGRGREEVEEVASLDEVEDDPVRTYGVSFAV